MKANLSAAIICGLSTLASAELSVICTSPDLLARIERTDTFSPASGRVEDTQNPISGEIPGTACDIRALLVSCGVPLAGNDIALFFRDPAYVVVRSNPKAIESVKTIVTSSNSVLTNVNCKVRIENTDPKASKENVSFEFVARSGSKVSGSNPAFECEIEVVHGSDPWIDSHIHFVGLGELKGCSIDSLIVCRSGIPRQIASWTLAGKRGTFKLLFEAEMKPYFGTPISEDELKALTQRVATKLGN
jgi:hypothetical protein